MKALFNRSHNRQVTNHGLHLSLSFSLQFLSVCQLVLLLKQFQTSKTAAKNIISVGWHWSSHNQNHITASLIWKLTPLWTWKSISLTGTEMVSHPPQLHQSKKNVLLFSQRPFFSLIYFFNALSELFKYICLWKATVYNFFFFFYYFLFR